ncbi:MAG: serine/threonine protein kinase, partial [Planctomycetes bacterium]|nr:serine/threonine protein kinase [Planctomycetota bacterium]
MSGDNDDGGFADDLRRFFDLRDGIANRPADDATLGGRYRILRTIGRGGQGTVFLARDEKLNRQVAIKVLTGMAWDEQSSLRFRREAEIASRLDHPNLCTLYDYGTADGSPFLAMRYVEGRSLAAILAEQRSRAEATAPRTPTSAARSRIDRLLELFETIARALHAAHEAGVVHRDLKPQNIMIDGGGDPCVLDFGVAADLAAADQTLTHTGDVCGTPAYMAPEQLTMTSREVDRRADVF